jgi:hypothetical protein
MDVEAAADAMPRLTHEGRAGLVAAWLRVLGDRCPEVRWVEVPRQRPSAAIALRRGCSDGDGGEEIDAA